MSRIRGDDAQTDVAALHQQEQTESEPFEPDRDQLNLNRLRQNGPIQTVTEADWTK